MPNGGKDFPAKMKFLEALDDYAASFAATGRRLVLCGDLNVARTDRDVHPKERKPGAIGQLPEERALIERILGRGLVDLGRDLDPDNDGLFSWWAPWRNMRQRNIGWRLDYVMASQSLATRAIELSRAGRGRHERPRAGDGDVQLAAYSACSSRNHEGTKITKNSFRKEHLRDLRAFVIDSRRSKP